MLAYIKTHQKQHEALRCQRVGRNGRHLAWRLMINSMHLATTNIYEIRENREQEAALPGEKLADGSAGVRMRAVTSWW